MKLRSNIIKLLALGLFATPIAFTSCSEDAMDAVNVNPNNPTDVTSKFILADVITSTAFNNVGSDINTYLAAYVEHEVGTYNQLWDAEHRVSQPALSSTFNNPWGSIYEAIRNAKIAIAKCSEGGVEAGNNTTLGVAQVLNAYNLALLTDMFGDVPYSEAFDPYGNKNPKIDKQEDLYKEVFSLLDQAIENLPKGDKSPIGGIGTNDLLYNGKAANWLQLAYGLKARYEMRLLNVSTDKNAALNKVIEYVDKSFQAVSDEAAFNVYDSQNLNPLFNFQWSRDGLAASKSIAEKLVDRNDPRLRRNFTNPDWVQVANLAPNSKADSLLAPNGENEQFQYYYLTSTFVYAQTASTELLSYHELLFLKAEAMQRLGASASEIESVLKQAVKAGIHNSEKSVAAAFVAPTVVEYGGITETTKPITDEEIDTYFDKSVKPLLQANALKEIANQKYLAFFGASGESVEMYNDIRRWKAEGKDLIVLKNPNKFPLRLPYGNSETSANPNVQAAFGNGQYVYTENVWWAGGSR
ncbi:SusD/RagB family nutrient-binding outer membrane lipoprotein [Sphingobacterium rhinopitheci]|uniref:SusD/RagB family nutrient-binding outer membrane lipoprotein n=1 Tax=Sphingobacterium rhinopitheci TaxID=2781960 RepID=UPI001F52B293|nr:SusD/RagB family nutrient-binding outer membrane lipoprotein [Sphingobacterium rhinopitheci]MCI0920447.1 SusD/RagB family nutrient-binding outer membrane lipoprotein [Sphingobacterium rhinopitheci]